MGSSTVTSCPPSDNLFPPWLKPLITSLDLEQLMVCVIINNSSFPTVKNNNTAHHAFWKYWIQARELLNYRLKYCWRKIIYCICQPKELERKITKKTGGAKQKSGGGMAHPSPPLESSLLYSSQVLYKGCN